MIGIFCLLAYKGGEVQPGDDMLGSRTRWWTLEELMDPKAKIFVPAKWILERAVELYRLWALRKAELQPDLDPLA
jgi:hypothetical protein